MYVRCTLWRASLQVPSSSRRVTWGSRQCTSLASGSWAPGNRCACQLLMHRERFVLRSLKNTVCCAFRPANACLRMCLHGRKRLKTLENEWKSTFFIMHMRSSCKAHEEKQRKKFNLQGSFWSRIFLHVYLFNFSDFCRLWILTSSC